MATASSRVHRYVRAGEPSGSVTAVVRPWSPTDTTLNGFGTVAVSANVALSVGWSLHGYHSVHECGSPAMKPPPGVVASNQPLATGPTGSTPGFPW